MPGEAFEYVMLAIGVDVRDKQQQEIEQALRGKICPHYQIENLPNAQFCSECKLVLTFEPSINLRKKMNEPRKNFEN
jgi:hypothetical protein